jgi:hypothetical protein
VEEYLPTSLYRVKQKSSRIGVIKAMMTGVIFSHEE